MCTCLHMPAHGQACLQAGPPFCSVGLARVYLVLKRDPSGVHHRVRERDVSEVGEGVGKEVLAKEVQASGGRLAPLLWFLTTWSYDPRRSWSKGQQFTFLGRFKVIIRSLPFLILRLFCFLVATVLFDDRKTGR